MLGKPKYERLLEALPEGEWLFPSQVKDIVTEKTGISRKNAEGIKSHAWSKGLLERRKVGRGTYQYKKVAGDD